MRGVGVTVARMVANLLRKDPYGNSTQFSVRPGSSETNGETAIRPVL